MDRIILGHSDFRQADLRAFAAASAAGYADLAYRYALIFICAERVRAAELFALQASFGGHFQTDFCADAADNAFYLVCFQGSNLQVRISDVRLTGDCAITASRASGAAAYFSAVGEDDCHATLYAVMRVNAEAVDANSIASRRHGR